MRARTLLVLATVTLAVVVAAGIAVVGRRVAEAPTASGGLLYPGLAARINEVARLDVVSRQGEATVARAGDGWAVQQKDGYPADAERVKGTVVALAEARIIDQRTSQPNLYDRLGVEDVDVAGASGDRVTLSAGDGADLVRLIVGKTAATGIGAAASAYVRKQGEAPSWLARARLEFVDADPMAWVERDLPRIPAARLRSVEIRQTNGRVAGLRRDQPDQPFQAFGLPDGATASPAILDTLAGTAGALVFEDVAKADPARFTNAVSAAFRDFDGLTLTVRTAKWDGAWWFALAAEGEGREAEAKAARWRNRYGGWAYRVFETTALDLTRAPADFIAKEPPAAKEP